MRNRGRVEIMGQILEVANGCSSVTQIMHKAFLSHTQVKEYVNALIHNGLLRYDLTPQTYKITEKGMRFLQIYNEIDDMINVPRQPEKRQQHTIWTVLLVNA
jgi:predicted transcriptional regulator